MDAPSNDPWFYSRDGVQHGPVTHEELRQAAQAGKLNPRQDLVWRQGMADWKPAGEIDGLFERRAPGDPPAGALAPVVGSTQDGYNPETPDYVSGSMLRDVKWPGVGRLGFIIGTVLVPLLLGAGLAYATHAGIALDPALRLGLDLLPLLLFLILGIQRLANLGMTRWWFIGHLVPIVNLWVGYRSFACPPGYAHHKKMDGIGIVLAILYWLLVLASLALFGFLVAAYLGYVGGPELQESIREMLEEMAGQAPAAEPAPAP